MRRILHGFRRMGETALEIAWSRQVCCQGCGDLSGADDSYLCAACARRLQDLRSPTQYRCSGCGAPVESRCVCDRMPHVAFARFAYYYQNPASSLVQNLKYRSVTCMADWMAEEMFDVLLREDWLEDVHALVPVPMPARRRKKRGYNQAELLAAALSNLSGLPVLDMLERTGETPRQALLKGAARRENVKGAFRALTDARGLCLLLIDDVRTTGATLEACAGTLRGAHASQVRALTFAAVCRPVEGD